MGKKRAKKTDPAEIEITEEMIRAGISKLIQWNPGVDRGDWIVTQIYMAMSHARRSSQPS